MLPRPVIVLAVCLFVIQSAWVQSSTGSVRAGSVTPASTPVTGPHSSGRVDRPSHRANAVHASSERPFSSISRHHERSRVLLTLGDRHFADRATHSSEEEVWASLSSRLEKVHERGNTFLHGNSNRELKIEGHHDTRSTDGPRHRIEELPRTDVQHTYAVFFLRSSGSTWLMNMLNQQRDTICYGEEMTSYAKLPQPMSQLRQVEQALATSNLEGLFDAKEKARSALLVGFKQKADLFQTSSLSTLASLGTRIIVLRRLNVVKHAISILRKNTMIKEIRARTGARVPNLGMKGTNASDALGPTPVRKDWFMEHVELLDGLNRKLDALRQKCVSKHMAVLDVSYEELLADPLSTLAKIRLFVTAKWDGISRPPSRFALEREIRVMQPPQDTIFKNTDDRLSRSVTNIDELRSSVPAKYKQMFDDGWEP